MRVGDTAVSWTRMFCPLEQHLVHLVAGQVTPGQFSSKNLQDNLANNTGTKE
jgi:hypothetical protein